MCLASDRLEKKGPFGDVSPQTSNRAELRAVIAALRFRFWPGEGCRRFVIATDSEYVVEGATNWVKTWVENGWKTIGGYGQRAGEDVKNRDLWEVLLGEVERYKTGHRYYGGMDIQFWKIPREWNAIADARAKKAAAITREGELAEEWEDNYGTNWM